MDVHTSMKGVTTEALHEAHQADLAIQDVQKIHERAGHPADNIYPVPVRA